MSCHAQSSDEEWEWDEEDSSMAVLGRSESIQADTSLPQQEVEEEDEEIRSFAVAMAKVAWDLKGED